MGNRCKTLGFFVLEQTNYYDLGNKDLRAWQEEICLFSDSVEMRHLNSQENVVKRSENLSFNTNQKKK